jgi:hypothetical protein
MGFKKMDLSASGHGHVLANMTLNLQVQKQIGEILTSMQPLAA